MHIKVVVCIQNRDRFSILLEGQPQRVQVIGFGESLVDHEFDVDTTEWQVTYVSPDAIRFEACDENHVCQAAGLDPVQHVFKDWRPSNWDEAFG